MKKNKLNNKRIILKNIKKGYHKKIKRNKKKFFRSSPIYIYLYKLLEIIFLIMCLFIFNNKKLKKRKNYIKDSYYSCLLIMAKQENKYIREFVEHYQKIGLDKIFMADDNWLNTEKLSDVLQDYIEEGFVEIMDVRGKGFTQSHFFKHSFDIFKSKCKWMLYFDADEFLEFVDKNLTLNDYLSQDNFNKCEVIKVNWVMYVNEDLLYYDNRPVQERFTKPTHFIDEVRTVKSIVRNDSRRNPWTGSVPHEPDRGLHSCNSKGDYSPFNYGMIYPPVLSICYLKHYYYKSAEEFAYKMKKGFNGNPHPIDLKLRLYFQHNKYSKEKVKIFEKIFGRKFNWLNK